MRQSTPYWASFVAAVIPVGPAPTFTTGTKEGLSLMRT
jgi:hypothetical protein